MNQIESEPKIIWLNNKFKEGYGEYLINGKYRIYYFWGIGTFSFKDRFTVLTPTEKFIHTDRRGSRSWGDDLEFIGELESIEKIAGF